MAQEIINEDTTIKEIVSSDYRSAEVFKKYGIDFCCGGKKTLLSVCNEEGVNITDIKTELKNLTKTSIVTSQDPNAWDLDFLADYIINTHHKYVIKTIPSLFEYTQKVAKVHGNRHPELIETADDFLKVMDELNRHMMKEENILFPYIKQLAYVQKNGGTPPALTFGTIKNPIRMMEMEHDEVGDVMGKIKKQTNHYHPPENACATYKVCYSVLKEFEDDLHMHIHLENNILFPKAIELEEKLSTK